MYPNEEFLPRAPDPEDIIIDGESTTDTGNVDFSTTDDAADDTKERIEEVVDVIENDAKCIEDNLRNEEL